MFKQSHPEHRPDGYPLTDQGRTLFTHAERVEEEIAGLDRTLAVSEQKLSGTVRITAAESVVAGFVLPALPSLRELHPNLRVEILPDYRNLSHTRREVDIALRSAHPDEEGLLARRIADLGFGLYASQDYLSRAGSPNSLDELRTHALIDWRESFPKAAPAVWFREIAQQCPVLKVNAARDRASAVELGIGIALLPFIIARGVKAVRVLPELPIPSLELWLMSHPETARIRRVRTVMDFLVHRAAQERSQFTKAPEQKQIDES
jgi:DNA-binding transcriptional LysR family regulator